MRDRNDTGVPQPSDCDHKYVLKGGAFRHLGGLTSLYQCDRCGLAFRREHKYDDPVDRIIFEGWNDDV